MSRPIGTSAELERRRRLAVQRVQEGEQPSTVARILGIPRSTLYRWRQTAQRGEQALAAKPHPGRPPALSDEQLRELEHLLLQGATYHGWHNDLWTGRRVAQLIRRHFDITLNPDHVVRMLRQRLNWTSQKPQKRAREQNDKEVERWKADEFARIVRESYRRRDHLVFVDESGYMLTPVVRRTLAPCGQTPLLDCFDRRDRISVISAISMSPARARLRLWFRLLAPNTNVRAADVVEFLGELGKSLPGGMTVLWDGSSTHSRSKLVQSYLACHREIVVEDFPSYAPGCNPIEYVWSLSKYGQLSNWAPSDVDELWDGVGNELSDLGSEPHLLASFINHADLPLRLS